MQRAYVGDWENVDKARELALAQIEEGVDFIFHNANEAGLGVFEAVVIAQDAGKLFTLSVPTAIRVLSPRALYSRMR